ncbi:glycosyltransferase [Desulfobacterota bacterium AH_259_B03_O07]|nr:glycosyltransferase [Desulfobacterota bacterium AH_259_B03_O07]
MKITILAIGSQGDVQPLVALGLGLNSAGHDITIATHKMFEKFVRSNGLEFNLIQVNPRESLESEAGQAALEHGSNPLRSWINFGRMVKTNFIQTGIDCLIACNSTDAIIYSPFGTFFAPHVSERLKLPAIAAYLAPSHATREIPSFLSPTQKNLGGVFNLFTWKLLELMTWFPYRSIVNKWRVESLDLPPLSLSYIRDRVKRQKLVLYGISPSVLPKPKDWRENIKVTGYWFLDFEKEWTPSNELLNFLSNDKPPVYVGFGSMTTRNPKQLTELVIKALKISNQRGILLTGWGCLGDTDLPEDVFEIKSAPHSWLFPRLAAVVHHGGAGTTAASLKAGKPTIVVPFFVDQPFWGRRVSDLGVGPKPIPFKRITAEGLAFAINNAVNDNSIENNATNLGERIRGENGVAVAIDGIEKFFSQED